MMLCKSFFSVLVLCIHVLVNMTDVCDVTACECISTPGELSWQSIGLVFQRS